MLRKMAFSNCVVFSVVFTLLAVSLGVSTFLDRIPTMKPLLVTAFGFAVLAFLALVAAYLLRNEYVYGVSDFLQLREFPATSLFGTVTIILVGLAAGEMTPVWLFYWVVIGLLSAIWLINNDCEGTYTRGWRGVVHTFLVGVPLAAAELTLLGCVLIALDV